MIEIGDWGLGNGIGDWGLEIRIRDLNWVLELRIGYWAGRLGIGTHTLFLLYTSYFRHLTFYN